MGVKLTDLMPRHEIKPETLAGKAVAIDASNHLYQFLTTIRAPDGALFTDKEGNVTSHLIGLFSRTAYLLQLKITPIYVFDGKPPELKGKTTEERRKLKQEAIAKYEAAVEKQDIEGMRKYAARSQRLTQAMVEDAKRLLSVLGVPFIQAPSEGEAQAARIVKDGNAYAVASQDADSLVFGAERLIRNLSVTGRRQAKGVAREIMPPEIIYLKEMLSQNGITQEQLVALSILVGTDYNPGGIKGIGPAKGLKLVKERADYDKLFEELKWGFDFSWRDVYDAIAKMPTVQTAPFFLKPFKKQDAVDFLCGEKGFSENRIESTLDKLSKSSDASQRPLGSFI
ncbi:MAG: flap endonuclease-1 [Candidatus Woesearchaeota archaeon]